MNLSKSEKLLAAKKQLREFQMNKMMQVGSIKQKQTSNVSSLQCQNIKTSNSDVANNIITTENSENNVYMVDQNLQKNKIIPTDLALTSESTVCHEGQNFVQESTKSTPNAEEIILKPELESKVDLNDFPKVQKEHLLEMASIVADVLTNDSENTETSLDSDLVCRNQFLSSYMEEQKKIVNDLHLELSAARSRISELETKVEAQETDFQTRLTREIYPLQEQLQIHTQTTGILIAEKAELTAALSQAQQSAKHSSEEAEEMTGKLKNSQVHIVELEKEISSIKNNNEELRINFQQLQSKYESLDKQFFELKKEKEDLNLEVSELKQKLNLKKTELIGVQQELQEKTALLSLSELRIQQMKGAAPTEDDKHAAIILEQELARSKESLKAVSAEKDETNKHYQNYVKQLDARQTKLLDEIKEQKITIENLQQGEQSYIQRLSELEQQLQQEREKVQNLSSLQNDKEQIDNLLKSIDELTLEQERLHITLAEKDTQIEILTKDVNDLRQTSNREAEVSKLASALESEQLGASRAVHQNRQLKEQLTDMENAFVSLSNAKLDLTEQLQGERSIGRKLNAQLHNVENELEYLKEKLKEKEAILEEFEKEKLQSAQIADQIQHYQAQSHHVDTFQRELEHALITIDRLEKEKQLLLEKLQEQNQGKVNFKTDCTSIDNNLSIENKDDLLNKELNEDNVVISGPIIQLEQRFKETMEKVAELTEEKQKLEHLVLQLQSETETIGEYITLYQKQRAVLQNRAREREQVFRQLLEQRNQQQEQLHKLKVLVSDFLAKEHVHSNGKNHPIEAETDSNGMVTLKKKEEITGQQIENKSVSELLDVLTEIKDCKDSYMFEPSFHPCPWCSGKLLTV